MWASWQQRAVQTAAILAYGRKGDPSVDLGRLCHFSRSLAATGDRRSCQAEAAKTPSSEVRQAAQMPRMKEQKVD